MTSKPSAPGGERLTQEQIAEALWTARQHTRLESIGDVDHVLMARALLQSDALLRRAGEVLRQVPTLLNSVKRLGSYLRSGETFDFNNEHDARDGQEILDEAYEIAGAAQGVLSSISAQVDEVKG